MDDDGGDDENVTCASVSIAMVSSMEMENTFTEPQNTSNENEFDIPIMSTPLPPRKRCRTRGGFNQTILSSPIVATQDQSQLLPQPSQATTLPASLSPSLSPLPTTPPQSLSPPPATPPRFLSPPPATPRILSPSPTATTPSLPPFYDPLTQLPSQYSGKANEFHWNDNGRRGHVNFIFWVRQV